MDNKLIRNKKIIAFYTKEKLNCKEICLQLNIDFKTCQKVLKNNNISIERYRNRRYVNKNINENFFKTINSEESAYYLGFIFADGNLHKQKGKNQAYKITIEINKKDIEILHNFNINNKINFSKRYDSAIMSIVSNKLGQDLILLGVTPNKTQTCRFPIIPNKYISHFIRGYFDGDGGFSIKNNNRLISYIAGNKEFLIELGKYLPCKYTITDTKRGIYNLSISTVKEEITKFIKFLYKDATIYLKRKYIKSQFYS